MPDFPHSKIKFSLKTNARFSCANKTKLNLGHSHVPTEANLSLLFWKRTMKYTLQGKCNDCPRDDKTYTKAFSHLKPCHFLFLSCASGVTSCHAPNLYHRDIAIGFHPSSKDVIWWLLCALLLCFISSGFSTVAFVKLELFWYNGNYMLAQLGRSSRV